MKTTTKSILTAAAMGVALFGLAGAPAFADEMKKDTMAAETMMKKDEMVKADAMMVTTHGFTKKKYKISGDVKIIKKDGQTIIRLSDDFRTKSGPDLKLFLSPQNVDSATGANATQGAVKLSVLKSNRGSQDYVVPAGVDLAAFNSLLIHCEAFSVLWGGADIG